jgi:hypothetical protein
MQNAQGGVTTEYLIGSILANSYATKQLATGSGKSELIDKEWELFGSHFEAKIYGKKGRRVRAARRLATQIHDYQNRVKDAKTLLKELYKINKPDFLTKQSIIDCEHIVESFGNTLSRMEGELAILKLRI